MDFIDNVRMLKLATESVKFWIKERETLSKLDGNSELLIKNKHGSESFCVPVTITDKIIKLVSEEYEKTIHNYPNTVNEHMLDIFDKL